ncbi:MAG: DUF4304 domain-containing protein [Verrucomicrobiota bacterium]
MISEIAKDRLDPLLKQHGFKRKNLAWNRQRGEFVDVVTLQKAKYSTATEQSITGNIAVCVPEFREIMFGETPAFLIEGDGVFTIRFAALVSNDISGRSLDRWWDLTNETQDAVASELSDIVTQKAVPFLDSCSEFSAIERHISQMKGSQTKTPYFQLNKALVYWKLGNYSKYDEVLSSVSKWTEKVQLIREFVK